MIISRVAIINVLFLMKKVFFNRNDSLWPIGCIATSFIENISYLNYVMGSLELL